MTASSTACGAVERKVASGHAPSAPLTVENAMRIATNTVIAKISASLNPASRSPRGSAPLVRLGSGGRLVGPQSGDVHDVADIGDILVEHALGLGGNFRNAEEADRAHCDAFRRGWGLRAR